MSRNAILHWEEVVRDGFRHVARYSWNYKAHRIAILLVFLWWPGNGVFFGPCQANKKNAAKELGAQPSHCMTFWRGY